MGRRWATVAACVLLVAMTPAGPAQAGSAGATTTTTSVGPATTTPEVPGGPVEDPADTATYDPYFAEQWGLQAIHAPQAWTRSVGSGVRIGIVDTGADLQHEDLAAKIVAEVSCVGSAGLPAACSGSGQDDEGHGTHVAGITAAITGNGKGVASVAPGADLVIVRSLGADGSGNLADVNAGIEWAVNHGARVVNLSLESDGTALSLLPGESLSVGVDYAWSHGAIPVIAAGNSTPSLFGPTGYVGVNAVIVGATGRQNEVAWYSSPLTGAQWGLVAPGGDSRGPDGQASCAGALASGCIVSTGWFPGQHNQYAVDEGTSMATPAVSGVLALLLAQGLTPIGAIHRMLATVDKIPCGPSCAGLVDAAAAVGAPVSAAAITQTTAPPPTSPVVTAPVVPASTSPTTASPVFTTTTVAPAPDAPQRSSTAVPPPAGGRRRRSQEAAGVPSLAGRRTAHEVDPAAVALAVVLLAAVGVESIWLNRRRFGRS
jgi:subtilisin family serine protease